MEIEQRLERLESKDAIKELASKYALALDVRDLDSLVNLFHEDVRVGKKSRGRLALKQWFNEISSGNRGFLSQAKDEFSELFYDQNIIDEYFRKIFKIKLLRQELAFDEDGTIIDK